MGEKFVLALLRPTVRVFGNKVVRIIFGFLFLYDQCRIRGEPVG
jgi:hypothetical protein